MDNERPIEKLLRRYAKKRRDNPAATGLELHPATRRMLQGEVSRQYPKPAPAGGTITAPLWRSLWPRLVYALPVLVVLGVCIWAIVGSQKSPRGAANLAKMESESATPAAQSRESLARNEPLPQPVGRVTPSNESGAGTLAYADTLRAKDNVSASGAKEARAKSDRAGALASSAPAPSAAAAAAPAPEIAALDKAVQEKTVAGRDALERFARDARADKARGLTLSARRAPAGEPAASLGA